MVKPNSLSGKSAKKTADRRAKSGKAKTPAKAAGAPPANVPERTHADSAPDQGSGETEKRILAAARREFIAKGKDGARMQVIAGEAGVNKALLHYYYRSKENLYQKVLEEILSTVWGRLQTEFRALAQKQALAQAADRVPGAGGAAGPSVEGFVTAFVSTYVRTLSANPDFPLFMFREIASGGSSFPFVLQELLRNFGDIPATLIKILQAEAKAGLIKPVHPVHFIMNMMGMTVATFLAMPMLQKLGPAVGLKLEFDDAFFEARIQSITDTLLNGIRIKR
jgi:TetR/AcrR family transcriptional regulator